MARYRGTFDTTASPQEAFDYLARFSNAAEWDPGVDDATMVTPEPVGLGSVFEVGVRVAGRATPWRYEVVAFDPPHLVTLRADRAPFTSIDTISVAPTAGGSQVTYDADLRLGGPLRVLDPLLALTFRRIGDRALAGLRRTFEARVPTP